MAELAYTKNGDYLIPDLILDDEDELGFIEKQNHSSKAGDSTSE